MPKERLNLFLQNVQDETDSLLIASKKSGILFFFELNKITGHIFVTCLVKISLYILLCI